jgi:hypothetical protein
MINEELNLVRTTFCYRHSNKTHLGLTLWKDKYTPSHVNRVTRQPQAPLLHLPVEFARATIGLRILLMHPATESSYW